ncbi:N-alpha-acetyltransferase 80 [Canis lupus familiaris]|uniref:N-alpha-acetyltransferase 80 n=2 Tax=Canis lupus TaxID=9612 RepID=UPI0015F15A1E|nr:N-alpha-acetyltransferase 80 [Canis lupus dingo]XP_038282555.1 N-alpha-acetyltransferase 80 [Canis lupus familiaris]XP_038311257.1 N-alpha-acetyltransferase 80 [Canis lupus familiaris]XP_038421283.1 N-alpha-acetyltransferase 80 [Canis lupus familiaris]
MSVPPRPPSERVRSPCPPPPHACGARVAVSSRTPSLRLSFPPRACRATPTQLSSRSTPPRLNGRAPLGSEEIPVSGACTLNLQPASETPATQQERTLAPSLTQLSLVRNLHVELTLSPRVAELTPGSACHPEMTLSPGSTELTLEPAHQPEETPVPSLAELTLEPVHCRPELLDACADLINEQWPRSRASRLHSLGQSSDAFPLCLMLLSPRPTPEAAPIVVGHARLSRVLDRPQSLLVETVVVARALRGRGFGRRLMEGLEDFAQARGFRRLHLTTHDQLQFYAHLGYHLGEPVQGLVFTSRRLSATLLRAFPRAPSPRPPYKAPSVTAQTAPRAHKGPSLPPPPPLPEPLTSSLPPPAGLPPQSLLETQYQDLRGCPIFWMEKDI